MDSHFNNGEKKKKMKVTHEDSEKRKIHRSKSACTSCHKARARCDSQRPCSRCQRLGIADRCETFVGKKRGRKPVTDRVSNPSSPAKEIHSLSPEERDEESDEYEPEHEHEYEYEEREHESEQLECLSSSCTPSPPSVSSLPSLPSTNHFSFGISLPSTSSISTTSSTSTDDLQKYMLTLNDPNQQQYQLDEHEHELEQEQDQRVVYLSSENHSQNNDDALVPSLTPPQYKEFFAPSSRVLPAIFLGVDETRSSKVFIRSVTRSFSELIQYSQAELEGMDFRDLMPRALFRTVLLNCYQKILENQDKEEQVFTVPTLLKMRSGIVPVELTFNMPTEINEDMISKVDVRELSMQEALNLQLPIFNYSDFDDSSIMNPLSFDDYLTFGGLDQTC